MSIDDVIRIHLRALAERESWRANDLPQGCTVNVLRVLDRDGLIKFHLWERADPNPKPDVNDDPKMFVAQRKRYTGWFSPFNDPEYGVDASDVLPKDGDDPELATEIKVSKLGTARLAELEIEALAEKDPPRAKTATPSRDRKKAAGDHTLKQLEMMGKARVLEKAICEEIEDDTGKSLTHILKAAAVTHERFNKSRHFKDARSAWGTLDSKRRDAAHFRNK